MTIHLHGYTQQAHRRAQAVLASSSQRSLLKEDGAVKEREGLSVLLLNRDAPDFIEVLLPQLARAAKAFTANQLHFEVLVGDTGSCDPRTLAAYGAHSGHAVRVVDVGPYHFSANNNTLALRHARGTVLLCLNNDIELPEPDLLYHMFEAQAAQGNSAHGCQLLYPDGTVQHGGVGFLRHDQGIFAYHLRHRQAPQWLQEPQPAPALTGALLMLRRKAFLDVGGFDTAYTDECQDIDLCLKLQRLGHRLLLHANQPVLHHENGTRVKDEENWMDRSLFNSRWSRFLEIRPELLPR
jgi:GT2 family glycosyltransferase